MNYPNVLNWLFFLVSLLVCSCKGETEQKEKPLLFVPDDLEATLWAESPQFYNPTNMDVDIHGRIWVTEAVNYRDFRNKDGHIHHPKGDRVVILEDTNGDGVADSSKVFVQDSDLVAPTGIAVIGNKVIISCSPSIIVYTDEDGDDKPDNKETFLKGFGGKDHDHGVHAGVAGPDGKWYFIAGNAGPHIVTDKTGWTMRVGSVYSGGSPHSTSNTPAQVSDDGKIWTGGVAFRINPDGTGLEVVAHNFRNSYEMYVDSFGNLWQNDNDDQVASNRTTFLMEGGSSGSFSADGRRTWQADRRPGQSIQTAHWHQEDPGVIPSGDVYGSGSPTGIALVESDALGKKYRGLLLNADAGRNIIFGYKPELDGAGYPLDSRTNFIASVEDSNEDYHWRDVGEDKSKWFRPSDVTIGTDGAIYVADWYDPMVGGHRMLDKKGYGRIYKIAPKDRSLKSPVIDLTITGGQIQALLSPAVNVRQQGLKLLQAQGLNALAEVKKVLSSENPYHRARAVWVLSSMGPQGISEVENLLQDNDPHIRITALRALKLANPKQLKIYAHQLVKDRSPAVRRAVAIALKDLPLKDTKALLLTLTDGYDGKDRWYLTALGIALKGKEELFYPDLLSHFEAKGSEEWPERLANLIWELHPPSSVEALRKRATSDQLSIEQRKKALTALAFIPTRLASDAVRQIAAEAPDHIVKMAQYWLQFRKTNDWKAFLKNWKSPDTNFPDPKPGLLELRTQVANESLSIEERLDAASQLSESRAGKLHLVHLVSGKRLPQEISNKIKGKMLQEKDRNIKALISHYFAPPDSTPLKIQKIASLPVDIKNGKMLMYSNCLVCHRKDKAGMDIGPDLTNIGRKYDQVGMLEAIVHPDAGIVLGAEPYLLTLKNGNILYGILLSNGPVVTLMDGNGQQFMIEGTQILSKKRLKNSLMPSPADMDLGQQEIADIVAFLLDREGA